MNERLKVLLLAAAVATNGCYSEANGSEPPLKRFYYPTGLAVSHDARFLYVVNSDFDLRYNGGSVQSFDLERLRTFVPRECAADGDCATGERCDVDGTSSAPPSFWCAQDESEPCGALGDKSPSEELLRPGRCGYLDPARPQDGSAPVLVDTVKISAFATDVAYRPRPGGEPGGRLFVPVRGDATLHWLEVDDEGSIDCGQRSGGECSARHRVGDDPDAENTRDLRLPREPFGIAATEDGRALVVTHQTQGAVSLFVNDWGSPVGPRLEFVVTGLPSSPSGVTALSEAAGSRGTGVTETPAFLVDFRNASELRLFRYFPDSVSQPARPFLQQVGATGIGVNANGEDSRGIAVDASPRRGCEAECAEEPVCLAECGKQPIRVYIANRSPSSLLVGHVAVRDGIMSLPVITDSIPMPYGPSRVFAGSILDGSGRVAPRIFLVCFDSRRIGVLDPELGVVETWIVTGRGPHALAFDVAAPSGDDRGHAFGYVGHFTDSYVGVVQLDQRQRRSFGRMVLTVGKPEAPRSSK